MTQRKQLLLCTLCSLIFFQTRVDAQIREYVGIVRPSLSPVSIANLEKFRDTLTKAGYSDLPEMIDGYLKGGFGSGFIYVGPDGQNYVVTNRHVVSQAHTASIEFEHKDGTSTKYDNLTVIAEDDDIDLAILRFAEGAQPFKKGLSLDSIARDDGEEIWSAGFPALSDTPMWQLGKGTITNAHAKVPELADPEKTYLLQHSAQVDAGNSGGPLLIASKASPGGYRVIGINTWKAVNRQAANYSIPSSAIESFIARSLSGKTTNSDVIQARSASFLELLTAEKPVYQKIARYISNDWATAAGSDAFMEILLKAPSAVRDRTLSEFAEYSPIEALRYSVAYSIAQEVSVPGDKASLIPDTSTSTDDGTYAYRLSSSAGQWDSLWKKEHGLYRIDRFAPREQPSNQKGTREQTSGKQAPKKQAPEKQTSKKATGETPYSFLFLGSYSAPLDGNTTGTIGGSMLFSLSDNVCTSFGAFRQRSDATITDSFTGSSSEVELSTFMIQFGLRLQIPFGYDRYSLLPYIQGSWGAGTATAGEETDFTSGTVIEGGVLVGLGATHRYYVGCALSRTSIKALDTFDTARTLSLKFSAGIGF